MVTINGLTLSGTDAANYILASITTTADITKATLTVTGITAENKVYDQTTAAVLNTAGAMLVGVLSGDTVAMNTAGATGAFADKNAGSGKTVTVSGLVLSGDDTDNYTVDATASTTADITKATLTGSVTVGNKVYDGTTDGSIIGRTLTGVIGSDDVTLTGGTATFADKNAGSGKTVTVSGLTLNGDDADNYTVDATASTTADITKATLTVTGITAENKVYDQTTAAVLNTASAVLVGVMGDETVMLNTAGAVGAFADKNAGTGKTVTVSGLTLSGSDVGNYTLMTPTTTADITPFTLTGSVVASDKVYDGTTAATITVRSLSGVIGSDNVILTGGTATFVDKNAGTNIPVSVEGLTLSGNAALNYTLQSTTAAATADITQATLTVTADSVTRLYGEDNPTFTATYTGFVGGETLATSGVTGSPSLTTTATASSPIATYTITAATGTLAAQNYSFAFANGILTVDSTSHTPTVATAATATPSPVTGTTTALFVLGADVDTGEASLTYTWAVTSKPSDAADPTFSLNGTNAAKNTTAVFRKEGTYVFTVTITDPDGLLTTSSVTVTVELTFTTITVSPSLVTLDPGTTRQFTATALDQFGSAMADQPPSFSWSTTIGTITGSGLLTAPSTLVSGTVTATYETISGTSAVATFHHAPVGTSKTVVTLIDTPYVFTASDFGFTDPGDNPLDEFRNVKITTPLADGAGSLTLDGADVAEGRFILVSDIVANKLVFTPESGVAGSNCASFTFQVQDGGGTDNDTTLDPTPETMTISIAERVVTWTGEGEDNYWSTAENWSSGSAPGLADCVVINASEDPTTIIVDCDVEIMSLDCSRGLQFSDGSLSITDEAILRAALLVSDEATLTLGGSWSNTGTITVDGGTVNLGGNFTTTGLGTLVYESGTVNLTGTLDNTGSTLHLGSSTGVWNLDGGAIQGGVVNIASNGSWLQISSSGTLQGGVTLNGSLPLQGELKIRDGLTLNGTIACDLGGTLCFVGTQSLSGISEILLCTSNDGIYAQTDNDTGTLTVGSGTTIHGQGTIGADWAGGQIVNQGAILADNNEGGSLTLGGAWINTGSITVDGGSLNLGGSFTTEGLGTFHYTAGTVYLTGTLDNTESTLNLSSSTGIWNLDGGTIVGGVVVVTSDAPWLVVTYSGTLDGVTLNGNLPFQGTGSLLTVKNGLTLNGTITMPTMPSDFPAMLRFEGTQTLSGSGQIVMLGSYVAHHALYDDIILVEATNDSATLTVGSGITIAGQGQISSHSSGNQLINMGTIRAGILDANGGCQGILTIVGDLPESQLRTVSLTNLGTLVAEGDSVLNLGGTLLRGQATAISDMELYLAWTGLAGGANTTYTLYKSTNGSNYSWLATLTAADSEFLFSNLPRNTAYALRVVAQDANGAKRIYDGGLVSTLDTPSTATWYKIGSITRAADDPSDFPADDAPLGTVLTPSNAPPSAGNPYVYNFTVDTSWVYASSPAGAILQLVHGLVRDCSVPTQAADGTWKVYHVIVTDDTYGDVTLYDGYTFDKSLYPSGGYSDVTSFSPYTINPGDIPEDTPWDPPCEPDQDEPCKDKDKCQTGSDAINNNGTGVGIGKAGTSVVSGAGTFSASAIDSSSSGTPCCGGGTGGLAYSSLACSFDSGYGPGWNDSDELPVLLIAKNMVAARFGAEQLVWFDAHSDGTYSARYGSKQTLVHNSGDHLFILTRPDGTVYEFYDADQTVHPQGGLHQSKASSGATIEVTDWTEDGRIKEVQYKTTPTGPAYQKRTFTYVTTADSIQHIQTQTLEHSVNGTAWTNVRRITYSYYDSGESYGLAGDLKTTVTQQWDAATHDWTGSDTYYFRYYTSADKAHELERVLLPNSYAKLASTGVNPLTCSDSQVAGYTCFYYQYDADRRASNVVVFGQSNASDYESALSTNPAGYNNWERRTIETRPDGSTNTVYTNFLGQTLLTDLYDSLTGTHTIIYNRYDNEGHLVLTAKPSAFVAVDGEYYDESLADLVDYASGNSPYLSDTAGLFEETVYYTSDGSGCAKGYVHETAVAEGETAARLDPGSAGGAIVQTHYEYVSRTFGNDTIYRVASETTYADVNGGGESTTNYDYTWYAGTFQVQEEIVRLPAVSNAENGSDKEATTQQWFNEQGELVWSMNELGRVNYYQYDSLTNHLQWTIEDLDATTAASLNLTPPTGWTLPTSGGIENTTDYQYDALSRVTQILGTAHLADVNGSMTLVRTATWTIYHDADHQTWTAQGYVVVATQVAVIVGPVSITKTDLDGRVTEQIQATWSGTLAELQVASTATAFPQSSYVAWTTTQYANTRVVSTRVYHDIPSSGAGTAGVNYEQTSYGYETVGTQENDTVVKKGRQNKTIAADGTITRVVLDARGNVLETWMGTNDTDATDRDPTGNHATANNMVKVSSATYDADGNLTESRAYFGEGTSDYYATSYKYDWRDRLTDTLSPANVVTHYVYDNLGRTVCTQTYASADFTPAASELRAQTETFYNDRGQVYMSYVYEVAQQDATTPGQVRDHLITSYWYDAGGNLVKSQTGAGTFTKTQYDGLGRATVQYVGYDMAETAAALYDANGNAQLALDGDTIIQQSQTWYDQAGESIATAAYERLPNDTTTGALTAANSYATASVTWYDGLGRGVASASYGREDVDSGLTHYFFNGTTGNLIDANADGLPDVAQNAPPQPYTSQNTSSLAGVDFQLQLVEYDAAGRAYRTLDNLGRINETQYDDAGRTVRTIQNYQNGTVEETDTDQDITVDYQYDSSGRMVTMTTYNAKGDDSNSGTVNVQVQKIKYLYTSAINASWQTAVVYADSTDVLSQDSTTKVWAITTDSGDHMSTTYDRLGRTTSSTDQRGVVHQYSFDSAGRVSADTVSSLGLAGQNVDGTVRRIGTIYDDVGRTRTVTSYSDTAGTVVSNQVYDRYDGWGNLAQEWQSHTGVVDTASTPSVQYVYDDGVAAQVEHGEAKYVRLTDVLYPNGRDVQYGYGTTGAIDDVMSRLATIGDQNGTYAAYTYLGAGKIVTEDYVQAQVKLDYAHDNLAGFDRFGRVVDQLWESYGENPEVLDEYTYTYDRAGNRAGRTNELNDDLSETYGYNDLDELTSSTRNDDVDQSWTLDGLGNWSSFNDDGTTQTRETNEANEITATTGLASPSYDRAGNMTTVPFDVTHTKTAKYDAWNHLVEVSDGGILVAKFSYDGMGRRIEQLTDFVEGVPQTATHYYLNGEQVIETREGAPTSNPKSLNPKYQNIWSPRYVDSLVLRDTYSGGVTQSASRLFYLADANYNVTGLVKQEETEGGTEWQVVERYAYSAYGKATIYTPDWSATREASAFDNTTLYTGRELDLATGLYYYRARYYSAELGTFVGRDPIGYTGGINLYEYVYDSPLIYVDPTGRDTRDPSYDYNGHLTKEQAYQLQGAIKMYLDDAQTFGPLISWATGDRSLTAKFLRHYIDKGDDWELAYDYIKDTPQIKRTNSEAEGHACRTDAWNTKACFSGDLYTTLARVTVEYTFTNRETIKRRGPDGRCRSYCRVTINGRIHDQYDFHVGNVPFDYLPLNFEGLLYGWKGGSDIPDMWMKDLARYGYAREFWTTIRWSYTVEQTP